MPLNRESRVSKIVEALLQDKEEIISYDNDFASGSAETFDSSTSTNSYLQAAENEEGEEEEDEDEALKALELYRKSQAKRKAAKYVDPALQQRSAPSAIIYLDGEYTAVKSIESYQELPERKAVVDYPSDTSVSTNINYFQQFKLSPEAWAHHLAVTQIWNQMTYNSNIARTNIQAQEQPLQLSVKEDRMNSVVWIRGDSKVRVFTDYLEIVLNSVYGAKFVVAQILNKTQPDDFWKLPDANYLPDDFDYRKYLDCFWRYAPIFINYQFITFDSGDQMSKTTGDIQYFKQVLAYSYPDESDEHNKSVQTIMSIQTENVLPIDPGHFIICIIPAKRTCFNRYYQMQGNSVVQGVMSVSYQTDMLAKNFQIKNQKTDDAQTFIIVDKKSFDLQMFDNTVLMDSIRNCRLLQIIRGRGRGGKKLSDLLQRIKAIRPDLVENESYLYQIQRAKTQLTVEYKAQLSGTFMTMYGAYVYNEPKQCEIVDNPLELLFIEEKIQCNVPRGPASQDTYYLHSPHVYKEESASNYPQMSDKVSETKIEPSNDRNSFTKAAAPPRYPTAYNFGGAYLPPGYTRTAEIISYQNGGDRETDVYRFFDYITPVERDGFKYHDPATGIGFNTIAEFKTLRAQTLDSYYELAARLERSADKIKESLYQNRFIEANYMFYQEILQLEPAWILANYYPERYQDTVEKMLGEHRYGFLE